MTKTIILVNINTNNCTLIPLTQTHKIIEAYSTWRTRLVMGSPSRVQEFLEFRKFRVLCVYSQVSRVMSVVGRSATSSASSSPSSPSSPGSSMILRSGSAQLGPRAGWACWRAELQQVAARRCATHLALHPQVLIFPERTPAPFLAPPGLCSLPIFFRVELLERNKWRHYIFTCVCFESLVHQHFLSITFTR